MPDKTAETDSIPGAAVLDEKRPFQIGCQAVKVRYFRRNYTAIARVDPAYDFGKYDLGSFSGGQIMTLGEELRRKYALTSLKPKAATLTIMAINEALEAAAQVADQESSPAIALRIRCLKWSDESIAVVSVCNTVTMPKAA